MICAITSIVLILPESEPRFDRSELIRPYAYTFGKTISDHPALMCSEPTFAQLYRGLRPRPASSFQGILFALRTRRRPSS
jgi:hypothetical protein